VIGAGELLLVLVVALLLFGPQKMLEIARTFGRLKRELEKQLQYAQDQKKAG
jgi:TatA/E family protein of Tat protein translocase